MDEPPLSRIVLAYALILVVLLSMIWFPRSWWSRMLRAQHGPSTDYKNMTRAETLRAAVGFLGIAGLGILTAVAALVAGDWLYGDYDRSQVFLALMFMSTLAVMMGVGGAGYLGLRAVFRPPTIYRWYEDPLSRTEFLKQYTIPGSPVRLVIVQHENRSYELLRILPRPSGAAVGVTPRVFDWGAVKRTYHRPTGGCRASRVSGAGR